MCHWIMWEITFASDANVTNGSSSVVSRTLLMALVTDKLILITTSVSFLVKSLQTLATSCKNRVDNLKDELVSILL